MRTLALLGLFFAGSVWGEGFCAIENRIYPVGEVATFYYAARSADIGPNYTCQELSRLRICEPLENLEDAQWSQTQPECRSRDSGSCADRWLDLLPDSDFNYTRCE